MIRVQYDGSPLERGEVLVLGEERLEVTECSDGAVIGRLTSPAVVRNGRTYPAGVSSVSTSLARLVAEGWKVELR